MKSHLYFLDFLRGLAALAVCLLHVSSLTHVAFFSSAYLAVDFFFMLSGFVLTLSHENKGTFGQFLISRLIRLYPMVPLAVGIGALGLVLKTCIEPDFTVTAADLMTATMLNGLLLPGPDSASFDHALFPANPALWSLFLELLTNLFWWVFLRQRFARLLIATAVSGLTVAALAVALGTTEFGFAWGLAHLVGGFCRALFGFCVGALICRYRPQLKNSKKFLPYGVVLILLLVVSGPGQTRDPLPYDLASLFLLLPAVLYAAAAVPGGANNKVWQIAGRCSYPLYLLHFPAYLLSAEIAIALRINLGLGFFAVVLMIVAVAHELAKNYDEPIRRKLSGLRAKYASQQGPSRPAGVELL